MLKTIGKWLLYLLGACGILLGLLLWIDGESDWGTILQFGAIGAVLVSVGRSLARPAADASGAVAGTSGFDHHYHHAASEATAAAEACEPGSDSGSDSDCDSGSDPD